MRTLTLIAMTAVLATPAAALSIVKVLTEPTVVSELSVQERENQFAELSVEERKDQFAELKNKDSSKPKSGAAPLFDTVRDTQIG